MEAAEASTEGLARVEGARAAWTRVGSERFLALAAVELSWIELPFRHPVTTATTTYTERPLALVKVTANLHDSREGRSIVEGWGECAALGEPGYVTEELAAAFGTLEEVLVPGLLETVAGDRDRLLSPVEVAATARSAAPGAPMAVAALEMAVADAHLRAERRSLAGLLGVEGSEVEAGAVVGMPTTTRALLEVVGALVDAGYRRIKLKIGPGWDVAPLEALAASFPSLRVQVDANGSYSEADADRLKDLDRFDLLCLEQPYAGSALAAHARLAAALSTPICLDECIHGPVDVADALAAGACSVVEVKPGRLGGIGAALEVIELCVRAGVPMWIGGMFESSFARGVNAALASLPGFAWPGDLSPAGTYLDVDLVEPARGTPPPGPVTVKPPSGPGVGPAPDPGTLERRSRRRLTFRAAAT